MHDTLRNAFVVEVRDFFTHDEVFPRSEGPRSPARKVFWLSATLTPWFVVRAWLVASLRKVWRDSTLLLVLLCDGVRATPLAGGCFFVAIVGTPPGDLG